MITFIIEQKIRKISDKYVRNKKFREYKDIHQVMLFFNMKNLEVVKTFVEVLIADGKRVTAYTYNNEADKMEPQILPDMYKILTKKNLNYFCFPHRDIISAFSKYDTDTLIDLTVRPSLVLKYLFLNSSSDFRIGFNRENSQLYDLLIERNDEEDFAFFVNQMLFYMKSLRSK